MGSPEVSVGQRGGAKANIKTPEEQTPQNPPHQVNMLRCRLLLVVALVISLGALLSSGQHWSHGWYPGGKRELNSPPSEISAELTLCESGECSYLRPQRRNVLRNIFLDAVARELHRK